MQERYTNPKINIYQNFSSEMCANNLQGSIEIFLLLEGTFIQMCQTFIMHRTFCICGKKCSVPQSSLHHGLTHYSLAFHLKNKRINIRYPNLWLCEQTQDNTLHIFSKIQC